MNIYKTIKFHKEEISFFIGGITGVLLMKFAYGL